MRRTLTPRELAKIRRAHTLATEPFTIGGAKKGESPYSRRPAPITLRRKDYEAAKAEK